MYEIKVDESKEEKKQRVADIKVKGVNGVVQYFYRIKMADIKSMDNVLRFIDEYGAEHIFCNRPYEIEIRK